MSRPTFVFTAAEECLRCLRQQVSLRHPLLLKSILCAFPLECGGLDPEQQGQPARLLLLLSVC